MWPHCVQQLVNPLMTLQWTRQNHGKEKQKLCTLIFSCLHYIILVLLNVMELGPQITRFILTREYSILPPPTHTQVKLWAPAVLNCEHPCIWASRKQ